MAVAAAQAGPGELVSSASLIPSLSSLLSHWSPSASDIGRERSFWVRAVVVEEIAVVVELDRIEEVEAVVEGNVRVQRTLVKGGQDVVEAVAFEVALKQVETALQAENPTC